MTKQSQDHTPVIKAPLLDPVPYRYLDHGSGRSFQLTPDQEKTRHPTNDPTPDHSDYLLTTATVRLNT